MASLKSLIPSNVMTALVLEAKRKSLVLGDVVNTDYQGVISARGDSVLIPVLPAVSVADYTRNATLSYSALDASSMKLEITEEKYCAYNIDRADSAQLITNIVPALMDRIGYEIRSAIDRFIAGLHGDAGITSNLGTTASALTITAAASSGSNISAYELISRIAKEMDNNNVQQEGRFLVISPWLHAKLILAGILTTHTTQQDSLTNGKIAGGRILGFDIRVSTNLVNFNAAGTKVLAGVRESISLAEQLMEINVIDKMETKIGAGIQALALYGAKVVQPATMAVATVSEATG